MKTGINIVAILLALIGLVWLLQGVGILKGSVMTGESQWAIIGVIAIIVAGGLVYYNRRRARV